MENYYYIITIEQVVSSRDEETGKITALNEYINTEKVADYALAESKFFTKCANVANDIGKNHTYMGIKIVNSVFGVQRSETIGSYTSVEPEPEPEEPEE